MTPIIYSKATGRVRRAVGMEMSPAWWPRWATRLRARVVVALYHPPRDGEAVLWVEGDMRPGDTFDVRCAQELVTEHTGRAPTNDRYSVLDEHGKVICCVIADPACGDAPEHVGGVSWFTESTRR